MAPCPASTNRSASCSAASTGPDKRNSARSAPRGSTIGYRARILIASGCRASPRFRAGPSHFRVLLRDRDLSFPEGELFMGGRDGLVRTEVGPTVVALPAELNAANAWSVGEELDSVLVPGITTVIVDLTATTLCDSSGVAVLALAHGKAVAHDAELRLVVPSAAVRHVLALAGLD